MKQGILSCFFALLIMSASAQTIDVNAPCLGATFTFTLDPTESPDASGRNVYFYSNASIEIQFNTATNRWEIRARGGNSDVYYFNTFASAPNPPDNVTSPWEDNGFCDGTGAPTVSGNGTQSTLGTDPCTELGGDSDGDGVCDSMDLCPGNDDNADQDHDNIPDACDDNPTVADGVLVNAPCLDPSGPIILLPDGQDAGGRNRYFNETYSVEISYNADLARWEISAEDPGTDVYFFNTFPSFPDPPASSEYPWTATGQLCMGSTATISGSGTQIDLGCTMTIAFADIVATPTTCPDAADGTFSVIAMNAKGTVSYSLDEMTNTTGIFTGLAAGTYDFVARDSAFPDMGAYNCQIVTPITIQAGIDDVLPTITCPDAMTVSTDAGQCTARVNYTAPEGMDNCSVVSTLLMTGMPGGAAFPLGMTTVTYEVTDGGGNKADCSFTVTVEDTEAPTAGCEPTATIELDTTLGYQLLTPELINLGSADNCSTVSLSIDRDTLFCTDRGELMVTLTATDARGLSSTCTTLITLMADEAYCTATPTHDFLTGNNQLQRLPLYPNPAREGVTIDLSGIEGAGNGEIKILITNVLGSVIYQKAIVKNQQQDYYLNTSSFAGGVYYIQVQIGNRPYAVNQLVINR